MEYFPPALDALVEQFARLPGIGRKTAQRLAFFVLSLPEEEVEAFAQSVRNAKHTIALCPVCQNLTEGDGLCPICASDKRDGSVICVVADPKDVIAMERAREYNGRYHVLHGVLSPMNGVGPDDLHIKSLLDRVAQGEVREVIMATNPDTEGEATVYLDGDEVGTVDLVTHREYVSDFRTDMKATVLLLCALVFILAALTAVTLAAGGGSLSLKKRRRRR